MTGPLLIDSPGPGILFDMIYSSLIECLFQLRILLEVEKVKEEEREVEVTPNTPLQIMEATQSHVQPRVKKLVLLEQPP